MFLCGPRTGVTSGRATGLHGIATSFFGFLFGFLRLVSSDQVARGRENFPDYEHDVFVVGRRWGCSGCPTPPASIQTRPQGMGPALSEIRQHQEHQQQRTMERFFQAPQDFPPLSRYIPR